jgi:hypothetical protein
MATLRRLAVTATLVVEVFSKVNGTSSARGTRRSLFRDLELDWTAGLVLDNCRPVSDVTAYGDVIDLKADEIATAKLAVDRKVDPSQIAFAVLDLGSDTNGPDLFRSQGRL